MLIVNDNNAVGSGAYRHVNNTDMDTIYHNPYRLLGVYSNSPTKERVANQGRMKAFLKVGKEVTFPLDFPQILPAIIRTADNVADAEAKLTLPNEQVRYAQFWFMKVTPFDEIAFNHLTAGSLENAIDIWSKKENVSSLQNRIVCALLKVDYTLALHCAERLYTTYFSEFVKIILGDNATISTESLDKDFLDALCTAVGPKKILSLTNNPDWRAYLSSKSVQPLVDTLQSALDEAKASKCKGSPARLSAGKKLMAKTKSPLKELKELLGVDDMQYQILVDKVGLEILQCGIDYYNDSDEPDAAHKAMELQGYAQKIVCGSMAKGRCDENVKILEKIIKSLPPMEVFYEDRRIKEELRQFCKLPDKICHAVTLLNKTKPDLQSIKAKLGTNNEYYLNLSTQVVSNALHNIIEEVNESQKEETIEISGQQVPISLLLDRENKIAQIKSVLKAAWNATVMMDDFDMTYDFKSMRYKQNRDTLKNMCEQLGISTYSYKPRTTTSNTGTSTRTSTSSRPVSPSRSASPNTSPVTSTKSENNSGCLIAIAIWVVLGCIAGLIFDANGGDFSAGFFPAGFVTIFIYNIFIDNK